jgi:hypothetical protein
MKLILSCSSEDTEFIDLVKKEIASSGTINEFRVSGITGYETVMLVLQIASVTATTLVPFIVEYMTSNKESRIKSRRCLIDNKNKTINLEGYDKQTIKKIVEKAIQEQNK